MWLLLLAGAIAPGMLAADRAIGREEALAIGLSILANETGGDHDKLVWWNEGEEFASLGIGHFIWYPLGAEVRFEESFPKLLAFLTARGVALPGWLDPALRPRCPWPNRTAFLRARDGVEMGELRTLLETTIAEQSEFMIERLEGSLARVLEEAPPALRPILRTRFDALYRTPAGRYALADYVNFKGEGVNPNERYEGEGWGLLQVLAAIGDERGGSPVDAFVDAAARVLTRRIANAPAERGEARWLPGWLRRIETYRG
jgi:hypothetical protein